ncbi:MAG: protein kinase [Deltaproteobacteria bacterium]|nr:protein kinase [Deltaproteobacteria bacterium]
MTIREPNIERKSELKPKIVNGRFCLFGSVGRGYYTERYRATDLQDEDRQVSLKHYLMVPHFTEIGATIFKWHVENSMAIDPHPNIIPNLLVFGGGEEQRDIFVIQEHIEGVPATTWVNNAGSPKQAVDRLIHVLEGICNALTAAEQRRELQYCLKPGDVLIENGSDVVKVGDIGVYADHLSYMSISSHCSSYCSNPVPIVTDYWDIRMETSISPSARNCVYALGILAYEIVTGLPPFGGRTLSTLEKHLHEPIPPLVDRAKFPLPDWLLDVINKCLEKDPALRFKDASCVSSALAEGRQSDVQPTLANRILKGVGKLFGSKDKSDAND